MGVISNLTCNGGSQSYCCSGSVPSSFVNTDSLKLVGQGSLAKRNTGLVPSLHTQNHAGHGNSHKAISKRGLSSTEDPACVFMGEIMGYVAGAAAVYAFGRVVYDTYGGSFSYDAMQEVYNMCVKPSVVVAHETAAGGAGVVASAATMYGQGAVGPGITDLNSFKTTITGEPEQVPTTMGSYRRQIYTTEIEECALTY